MGKPRENPGLGSVLDFLITPSPNSRKSVISLTVSVEKSRFPLPAQVLTRPLPPGVMGPGQELWTSASVNEKAGC